MTVLLSICMDAVIAFKSSPLYNLLLKGVFNQSLSNLVSFIVGMSFCYDVIYFAGIYC